MLLSFSDLILTLLFLSPASPIKGMVLKGKGKAITRVTTGPSASSSKTWVVDTETSNPSLQYVLLYFAVQLTESFFLFFFILRLAISNSLLPPGTVPSKDLLLSSPPRLVEEVAHQADLLGVAAVGPGVNRRQTFSKLLGLPEKSAGPPSSTKTDEKNISFMEDFLVTRVTFVYLFLCHTLFFYLPCSSRLPDVCEVTDKELWDPLLANNYPSLPNLLYVFFLP